MAYSNIDKPTDYFNTVLWSGDGTSPRTISGVGFQPDWVWLKHRSGTGTRDHYFSDVARGATKSLNSNTTDPDVTEESNGYTSAFTSDGFTLTAGTNSIGDVNDSARSYVAWNWLAGGSASSNSDGSVTSSVSVNTTAGFSVGTYTSPASSSTAFTVGHGLGVAPKMYWVKTRDSTGGAWTVFHEAIGAGKYLFLNTTDASASSTLAHNNTAPTTSVFSQNTGWAGTSRSYVYYAFSEIKGYSKFGSYTGNGNADGTFVYTGFRPAFVLIRLTSAGGWVIWDNKRDTFNVADSLLFPHANNVETVTGEQIDILSNGFKARSSSFPNNSGSTLLYMAFAESPLVGSNFVPTNAR